MKKLFLALILLNLNLVANNITDLLNQAIISSDFETVSNIFKNHEFRKKEKLIFLELAHEVHNRIYMNTSLNTRNILDFLNKEKYTIASLYLIYQSLCILTSSYHDFLNRYKTQNAPVLIDLLNTNKFGFNHFERTIHPDQAPQINIVNRKNVALFNISQITYTLGFLTFTAIIVKKALNSYQDNKESFEKASENSTKIKQLITLSLNDSDSKS